MNYIETVNLPLATLRWRSYTVTTSDPAGTPVTLARAAVVITAVEIEDEGDYPVITAGNHRLSVGDWIVISGADVAAYNRAFRVHSVVNTNSFTVRLDECEGYGAVTVDNMVFTQRCMAQSVILITPSANTAAITFGPAGTEFPVDADDKGGLSAPHGAKFDLADLYAKSADAAQTITVMYL